MPSLFLIPWRSQPTVGRPLSLIPPSDSQIARLLRLRSQQGAEHCYAAAMTADGRLRLAALTDTMDGEVRQTLGDNATSFLIQTTSYAKLIADAPDANHMKIVLQTPCTFFRSDAGHDVLPTPLVFFGHLVQRWAAVGGPPLPAPDLHGITTVGCGLTSERVTTSDGRFAYGVTGRITYRAPPNQAKTLWALIQFGEFAGVGMRTACGWGRMYAIHANLGRSE